MTLQNQDQEQELIRRSCGGDSTAFQTLADQIAERLYRCAHTLCRDQELADDLTQETLLEAWRCLARFDGRCQFTTWLYGILRHRYLKALRRRSPPCIELPSDDAAMLPYSPSDPARDVQRADDAAQVRHAVATLPEEHRQVIELRFFADASLDDIAATLGIPLGTVKSRLHNGLEKLRHQKLSVNLFAAAAESSVRQP